MEERQEMCLVLSLVQLNISCATFECMPNVNSFSPTTLLFDQTCRPIPPEVQQTSGASLVGNPKPQPRMRGYWG
jgi:hypothetical protein